MEDLADNISRQRKVKGSTINIYLSNIRKVYKELFDTEFDNLERLYDYKTVIKYTNTLKNTTAKNILTAIVVSLKTDENIPEKVIKKYNKKLEEKTKQFFKDYQSHEKNKKDNDNWVTKKEVEDIKKNRKKALQNITPENATRGDIDTYQQYLILVLYTELPPLRNNFSDTTIESDPDVALSSPKNSVDLTNEKFILKVYKTDAVYGTKFIPLPKNVVKVIEEWTKYNDTGYLLINTTNKTPMTSNGITKYLNKIFSPKKVSTTLLRKLYLSDKYSVQAMEDDAYIMGHSVNTQQLVYRKKNRNILK